MKNDETMNGEATSWKNGGAAPWWCPYPPKVIASVLYGAVIRHRAFSNKDRDRFSWAGRVTAEFVLRGYRVRDLKHGWSLVPWSLEKREMLRRLHRLHKAGLRTEGRDFYGAEEVEEEEACRYRACAAHLAQRSSIPPRWHVESLTCACDPAKSEPGSFRIHYVGEFVRDWP